MIFASMTLPVLDADLESFLIYNILMFLFFCYVLRCKYFIIAITRDKQTDRIIELIKCALNE